MAREPLDGAGGIKECRGHWDADQVARVAALHDLGKRDARFDRAVVGWGQWAAEWWSSASDEERIWLEVQLRRAFPEWVPEPPALLPDPAPQERDTPAESPQDGVS